MVSSLEERKKNHQSECCIENVQLSWWVNILAPREKVIPFVHIALADESTRYSSFIIALNFCPTMFYRVMIVSIQAIRWGFRTKRLFTILSREVSDWQIMISIEFSRNENHTKDRSLPILQYRCIRSPNCMADETFYAFWFGWVKKDVELLQANSEEEKPMEGSPLELAKNQVIRALGQI